MSAPASPPRQIAANAAIRAAGGGSADSGSGERVEVGHET